jgi:uncharacterized membrane protein
MKTIRFFFFASLILTGFLSGMGFANAVGYIPAMEDTPTRQLITFWQHTDHYMRARMPVLGNSVLLVLLVAFLLVLRRKPLNRLTLLLTGLAFTLQLADLVIILTQNLPVNQLVEKLTPDTIPAGFEIHKRAAVRAYYLRSACNIAACLCVTLAYFRWEAGGLPEKHSVAQTA